MKNRIQNTPFQKFDSAQSLGGIILFAATILAVVFANTPLRDLYETIRSTTLTVGAGEFALSKPALLWVNDGLMAVFFFLIGLEIKRELLAGELNTPAKASLPVIAAIGGMAVPVLFFLILNKNPETEHGWGIPMATDIAFSLAVLRLLGKRVPTGLKVFLTAFAIIDDLGAVAVIALFYSAEPDWMYIVYALVPLSVLVILSLTDRFNKYFHLACGIVVWYFFLKSGIHPTIAGVLLAFTVPLRQKTDIRTYAKKLCEIADEIGSGDDKKGRLLTDRQMEHINDLGEWTDRVQSPLQHLEHTLHPWITWFIMPVFAFFNAGMTLGASAQPDMNTVSALAISLLAGKSVGVTLFSLVAVKMNIARLPDGVRMSHIAGVSLLAGIGFTMSIFIAGLAFPGDSGLIDAARLGIISGSLVSGITGYTVLRMIRGGMSSKEKLTVTGFERG